MTSLCHVIVVILVKKFIIISLMKNMLKIYRKNRLTTNDMTSQWRQRNVYHKEEKMTHESDKRRLLRLSCVYTINLAMNHHRQQPQTSYYYVHCRVKNVLVLLLMCASLQLCDARRSFNPVQQEVYSDSADSISVGE